MSAEASVMEPWQIVTTISGATVAIVALGGAAVAIVKHPFAKLRAEIGTVCKEGKEAHETIGSNINALGTRLEGVIRDSSTRLEGKVDGLSTELTAVGKQVSRIKGAMPHIEARLSNVEGREGR